MTTKASKESVLGQTKQGATKTHVSPLGLQGAANFHKETRNSVARSKGYGSLARRVFVLFHEHSHVEEDVTWLF